MIKASVFYFDRFIGIFKFLVLPKKEEVIKFEKFGTYKVKEVIHFFRTDVNKSGNRMLNSSDESKIRIICE